MAIEPRPRQSPTEVVSIGGWAPDEDFPYGPQGAKPKRLVICPEFEPLPFLVRGHRYLFKQPAGGYAQQIWSEVIAYELGKVMGIPVPPAFIAYDPIDGSPGVLVEYFFGHPYELRPTRFIHAIERFQARGLKIDERRGSLRENILLTRMHQVVDWRERWAEMIAFDAVIANTDRHSQNCGFLIEFDGPQQVRYLLAPAFDNGTSLGFRVLEKDLERFSSGERLERFVRRGGHHFSWLGGEDDNTNHADLCARFNAVFGGDGKGMARVIQLSDSAIDDILDWATRFQFEVPFSGQRRGFVTALVRGKRDALVAALGG
jgi:hypothetical protein